MIVRSRRRVVWALLGLLLASAATNAVAQATGGLVVLVADADGPLPGATVTIRNAERRIAEHSALTDRNGRVDFPVLPPGGAYAIEILFPGYATVILDDLRVRPGEHETLPVRLAEEYTENSLADEDRHVRPARRDQAWRLSWEGRGLSGGAPVSSENSSSVSCSPSTHWMAPVGHR